MNKRIQQRSEEADHASLWWDAFGTEFFDDDASLTLKFQLDDGPKRYTIGRTLIPRYFRSIFDGGVTDLFYVLRYPIREFCPGMGVAVLECDHAAMVTRHGKDQGFTEVISSAGTSFTLN
jgi:LIM domain-binding protein 1